MRLTAHATHTLDAAVAASRTREIGGLFVAAALGRDVDEVVVIANRADDAARAFRFDDEEHLAARIAVARAGRVVVGIWHTHLDGSTGASVRDRDGFAPAGRELFPGEALVVVGVDHGCVRAVGGARLIADRWLTLRVDIARTPLGERARAPTPPSPRGM